MARTSRIHKREQLQAMETTKNAAKKIYNVALYVRLSVLDSGHKDGDAAETQELLLRRFIEGKSYFSLFSVYMDNGESGVDFVRSGFEQMMEDVKKGLVDCIIVKDLSRFGRNYIEAGEYLEKVFPFLGVRFIAVNDGIDTDDPTSFDSLTVHLKNLVNDMYARDISVKIGTVLRRKQERGEFIGAWAAYGYQKSKEDKYQIIIDEKTAPVVRGIFTWRLAGLNCEEIVRRLTIQGIPSPSKYRYMMGLVHDKRLADVPWRVETIKAILRNEVYLGHTVQGRSRKISFQEKKRKLLPREDWIIVKNTHKAIIDPSVFEQVQQMNFVKREKIKSGKKCFTEVPYTENILKGLVYCGCCGRRLVRHRDIWENKYKDPKIQVKYRYLCPHRASDRKRCAFQAISEEELLQAVFEKVQVQIQFAKDIEKIISLQNKNSADREPVEWQLEQTKEKLEKIGRYKENLYDDYADNLMDEQDYIYAKARYEEKETDLQKHILELNESLQQHKDEFVKNLWLRNILCFGDMTKLTREMALALIEKITVYHGTVPKIIFRFQDDFCKLQGIVGKG